jgi:hypothetical protein
VIASKRGIADCAHFSFSPFTCLLCRAASFRRQRRLHFITAAGPVLGSGATMVGRINIWRAVSRFCTVLFHLYGAPARREDLTRPGPYKYLSPPIFHGVGSR